MIKISKLLWPRAAIPCLPGMPELSPGLLKLEVLSSSWACVRGVMLVYEPSAL